MKVVIFTGDRLMTGRERLLQILKQRSICTGMFKLASGGVSNYYADCKMTTLSSEGLNLIAHLILERLKELGVRHIGGLTLGADPIASAVAALGWEVGYPVDAFIVRKKAKDHGTGKLIEGPLSGGEDVVVVEDVMTQGNSALAAIEAVQSHGCRVREVITIIDRMEGGKARLESMGYKVFALFDRDELLKEGQ